MRRQIKPKNPPETKRHFSLKIGVGEDVVVEVVMVVEVFKVATSREDSQASKIGVAEDVVKEVVERITPTSSVTNVTNRGTMRRIAILTIVIIVVKWDILQKTVD